MACRVPNTNRSCFLGVVTCLTPIVTVGGSVWGAPQISASMPCSETRKDMAKFLNEGVREVFRDVQETHITPRPNLAVYLHNMEAMHTLFKQLLKSWQSVISCMCF